MLKLPILLAAVAALAGPASSPVKWSFASEQLPNGQARIDLTATIEAGWHMYATQLPSDQGPLPTVITFTPDKNYDLVDVLKEPEPEKADDPNFGMVLHFHSGAVTFSQVLARKTTDAFTVSGEVEYMVCDDHMCLPPVKVPFTVEIPKVGHP